MELDWDVIAELPEVQHEKVLLSKLISQAMGLSHLIGKDDPLIQIIAHIRAIQRHFIRNMVSQVDMDSSEYLELLKEEIGFNLPLTESFPLIEFLRESKFWNAHKGTEPLFEFIGSLIGSDIQLYYPKTLIFRLSRRRSRLSGAASIHGLLPFNESCRAHIRDGIYWANFTYVVDVLQAQEITSFGDLRNLLRAVHPAGTKRFVLLRDNFISSGTVDSSIAARGEVIKDTYFQFHHKWPTLDNNLFTSNRRCRLSMHNGTLRKSYKEPSILQVPPLLLNQGYRRINTSTLFTNNFVEGKPNRSFSRFIWNDETEDYDEVFSDNDSLVYQNVTTNIGFGDSDYESVEDLTFRHVQDAAWDKDLENEEGQEWYSDLPEMSFIEVV